MKKSEPTISHEFKAQASKAVGAIALFIFTYILLLLLAIALTVFCMFAGYMMIKASLSFLAIALGIGLASFGLMILIFLIKFVFKSNKIDRSDLIEISRTDEPALFEMIDELVHDIKTTFPKKVYLSSNVNASVFYDSSFWSMFLPVKKNLQIGLGLVNTVTKSELKAILAHEFGHFSQRSMKVGSYVYNVNQIIFNLVNDNESYENIIQKWAAISNYFAIFVSLAVWLIKGIQWILKKMYALVNKSYMALSREMEFHADAIAAHITGYEPLKNSLLRLDLADYSYNAVLSFYDAKISQNLKSENIYKDHTQVINFIAHHNAIQIENDLPLVSIEEYNRFNNSKLVIKDQWASHPSTEERIKKLEETQITATYTDNAPANLIFKNIEATQQRLSKELFKDVKYEGLVADLSTEAFLDAYREDFLNNSFSKIYKGYYDNKNPVFFDTKEIHSNGRLINFEEIFSEEIVEKVYNLVGFENDLAVLKQIADKSLDATTFDYDGQKYNVNDCPQLIEKLTKEIADLNVLISENDVKIFNYFRHLEHGLDTPSLEDYYNELFEYDKEFESNYKIYLDLNADLEFIAETTPIEVIKTNLLAVEVHEKKLKEAINKLLNDARFESEITKEIKENWTLYISKKWTYFGATTYYDKSLEILYLAMNNYAYILSRGYFLLKKRLLDYQESLFVNKAN